ncbi:hypothetical protein EGW08_008058, partial [Elysia chlorotica]
RKVGRDTAVYPLYTCPVHGQYRAYEDSLHRVHRWVMIWLTLCVIPVGILVVTSDLTINWIFTLGSLLALPAVPGIVFSLAWVKATAQGLIAGSISGMVCGVGVHLAWAATLEGGLWEFQANPTNDIAAVAGAGVGLVVSLCVTLGVSLATHTIRSAAGAQREWQKLRDIDNPLSPWQQDMRISQFPNPSVRRPTYQELQRHNRPSIFTAYIGSTILLVIFVFAIPGCLFNLGQMTSSDLRHLVMTLHIVCFVTATLIVILVPLEEVWGIRSVLKGKRRIVRVAESSGQKARLIDRSSGIELKEGLRLK